jgi:hypothetical protein
MAPVRRHFLVVPLVALLLAGTVGLASERALVLPTAPALAESVAALTAPAMEGRRSGTEGGERAAHLIADWLRAAGLQPGGDGGSFFQSFVISTGTRLAAANALEISGAPSPVAEKDWRPHGGSANGDVEAEVVFVGYGIGARERGYDDYANVDVRGRIAVAFAGAPAGRERTPRIEKLVAARERGARALLIVEDRLPELTATAAVSPLPSASVRSSVVVPLLTAGESIEALAANPRAFATGRRARLRIALERVDLKGVNVIGIIPGRDPALADETVVVGAHYDHLGRVGGAVHHGADDNASGTAVVVGLARAFASAGGSPRTLVFALFGAEELGLVGSGHYVRHPARPLTRTVGMVNFDMVGRLRGDRLTVGGVESASGFREIVSAAAAPEALAVTLRGSPYGPSDHARFYRAGVPVLFFHTGTHDDYHRPTDTPDKLETAGMARIAVVGAQVIERLGATSRPVFAAVPPPTRGDRGTRAFLGVQGDGEADGARLTSVVAGGAAERAGLREGDVLIRLAGASLMSFDDLRAALRDRRVGERVDLVFVRDGEQRSVTATLGAAP